MFTVFLFKFQLEIAVGIVFEKFFGAAWAHFKRAFRVYVKPLCAFWTQTKWGIGGCCQPLRFRLDRIAIVVLYTVMLNFLSAFLLIEQGASLMCILVVDSNLLCGLRMRFRFLFSFCMLSVYAAG